MADEPKRPRATMALDEMPKGLAVAAQLAKIETTLGHILATLTSLTSEVKETRERSIRIEAKLEGTDKRVDAIEVVMRDHRKAAERDFRIGIVFTASVGLTIIGFMAKGFHWL